MSSPGERDAGATTRFCRHERAKRFAVCLRGRVQGVGLRPFVYNLAQRHGLSGWVRNDDGGLSLDVQGARAAEFMQALQEHPPPLARIAACEVVELAPELGRAGFAILASIERGDRPLLAPPDLGVCRACCEEMLDPTQRRYRYPFLACTDCGPRFTIARGVPYDRERTSLQEFGLCAACRREYEDPSDRRFHAQAIACPDCGPQLSAPLAEIAETLARGGIVALKGIGGFHLLCDARDERAVRELRRRKQREGKPFAVMVLNLASARQLGELSQLEAALLAHPARPIVLMARRDRLAGEVAPGLPQLGVMLPYAPVHLLLFHELLGRPPAHQFLDAPCDLVWVATSANLSGAPLISDDEVARRELASMADLIVCHDRPIVVRADDSLVRAIEGAPMFLRRARGFVPEPIELGTELPPVAAVGAHLKATVCLIRGKEAFVSQHIGDLDHPDAQRALHETLTQLARALDVAPVAAAHDLHPDFPSTSMAQRAFLRTIAVQHHHAHLAAVLAEHRRDAATVGLALDGFGYGTDGEAWGGELLLVAGARFQRLGHLRPLRAPGLDQAAKEPWRMAASALHALGRREAIVPRLGKYGASPALVQMLERGIRAPLTTSCGRWFDAACGLLEVCPHARYEGEAPSLLEGLVRRPSILEGGFTISDGVLDLLPLLAGLADADRAAGAELFHGTLVRALCVWALPEVHAHSPGAIALSGGCAANRVLVEGLCTEFSARGVEVLLPRALPANDGGLSLGQAWVAARLLDERP